MLYTILEVVVEKTYNLQENIGSAKYVVNFHNGQDTHKDGSPFVEIRTFSNLRSRNKFIKELEAAGYKYSSFTQKPHYLVMSKPCSLEQAEASLADFYNHSTNRIFVVQTVETAKEYKNLIGKEYLEPKALFVQDHNEFRLFDYTNTEDQNVKLGQIVFHPEEKEVGVVIQTHGNGEFRTDQFGNTSLEEVRNATEVEIEILRPELLKKIKTF